MNAEMKQNSSKQPINSFGEKMSKFFKRIWKALHNQTFLYVVRRILSACLTAILISAVISLLISFIPDTKFYNVNQYKKLFGQYNTQFYARYIKAGLSETEAVAKAREMAEKLAGYIKYPELAKYGRCTPTGEDLSVLQTIVKYIYWILPIPKEVAIAWDQEDPTKVIKTWKGWCYFGRAENGEYVTDILTSRMGISFKVTFISIFLTYLISYPFGIAMAKKPGGLLDKAGNVFIVLNYAIPALVFYLFMQVILGDKNGIFGFLNLGLRYVAGDPKTLFAPIFCMVFLSIPGQIIWLRRFMIDELSSDYVKFARSKGLSENRILYTHVLRNAAVPLIRNIPAVFIGSIMGSYYVEAIWGIPGTGGTLITGVQSLDVAIVQGLTIIYALLGMLSFLLGDVITVFFDPRIKLTGE